MATIRRAALVASALMLIIAIFACGDKPTAPSVACSAGPYSFDSNVQRCRAGNGEFAPNTCCGR